MVISITDEYDSESSPVMSILRPYREGMTSLDSIAITIDREGFEALDKRAIDTVLDLAATADASPVLAEVFADDAEPAPVRERAFGLLAMQITSAAAGSSPAAPHRLRPRNAGSVESTPCSTSKARSRRSRVQVPASGAELRASWRIRVPTLR